MSLYDTFSMLESSRCFHLANLYSVLLTRFADLLFTGIFELDNATEVSNMFCNRLDLSIVISYFPHAIFMNRSLLLDFSRIVYCFLQIE